MRYGKRTVNGVIGFGAVLLGMLWAASGKAQTEPEIPGLVIPPTQMGPSTKKEISDRLTWYLTRLARYRAQLQHRQTEMENLLAKIDAAIGDAESQAPFQFRYLDQSARALLVGRCLEQMLEAKLELAAHEAIAESLGTSGQPRVADRNRIEILRTQLQMADAKLRQAQDQLKRVEELRARGVVPDSELAEVQNVHLDAETQLRVLQLELQTAEDELNHPQQAAQVADLRIKNAALRAKIDAANRFLQEMTESGDVEKELRSLQARRARAVASLDLTTKELEVNELRHMHYNSLLELYSQGAAEDEGAEKK